MFKITTAENQSIFDIAIQEYGGVEGIFLLMEDNPDVILSFNSELLPGTVLLIRKETTEEEIEAQDVQEFFRDRQDDVTNGEVPAQGDYNDDFNQDFLI